MKDGLLNFSDFKKEYVVSINDMEDVQVCIYNSSISAYRINYISHQSSKEPFNFMINPRGPRVK